MKKEIISFVIGAGIVGSIWCCKTFRRALESHKDFEAVKLYIDSPLHNLKYVVDKEVQMTENFYIDEKGIHFIYNPYEIACFAAHTIDIFVPYKIKFNAK